jgi:hypothetical protein
VRLQQSLRLTHPTHWLVVVSHVEAAPMQCLFAVQVTQRPLAAAQAGLPDRLVQSLSLEHFAHRLARQSRFSGEQSLSVLQVPAASTVGPIRGTSGVGASGGPPVVDTSGAASRGASGAALFGQAISW